MAEFDDPALLGVLMDAAAEAIIVADAEGCILRANRAAATIFQRPEPAMIGQNVSILMPGSMAILHDTSLVQHMVAGSAGEVRVSGKPRLLNGARADGSRVPLMVSLGRAETDRGAVFVAILNDHTEQVAMREAAERSQKMDAIGRMTGGIAHDFNNLLTVIIGNLELLEAAALTPRQRALLADALSAAEMGADLTSRLSTFARNSDLRDARLDLNEQVESSVGLMRHTIGTHCAIAVHNGPELWPVCADPTRLQTAILNLAMNAQDAMHDGGLLTIETQNVSIDDAYMAQELDVTRGRYVRLSLTDTGRGMSAQERSRALEPFFTTKAAGHGTGLGLPMVYGFVKQSGGHLTIYSEPGQGTTVSLYFPALDEDAAATPAPGTSREIPQPPGPAARVLIVEDDEKLRRLTQERLQSLGFDCLLAANADTAWAMLAGGAEVDLVFSDMVMPGTMSGYDLALRIARDRPGIRILLTSGFSESVLRDRVIGDAFAMLRKPYRIADLQAAIHGVLGRD